MTHLPPPTRAIPVAPTTFPVADLERRFYAFAADRALSWTLYVAAGAAGWALWGREGLLATVGLVLGLAVLVVLLTGVLAGATGATPGKRMVGLRVVHQGTGTPIGVGPGLLRSLVLGLSTLPTFGFGLAALAWTALLDGTGTRRGWHDRRAGSVVVDVRPAAPEVVEGEEEAPRHVVNLTALRLMPAPAPEPTPQVERPARPAAQAPAPPPSAAAPAQTPTATPTRGPAPAMPPTPVPEQAVVAPSQDPSQDPGRTVVRGAPVRAGGTAPGTRWRVSFDTGESFVVEGLTVVGRRPEPRQGEAVRHVVPLPSADMSLSKTHAQFGPAPDGSLVVMDRGSTNGSVLLRQGVARELTAGKPATLVDGDRVRFGDREMAVSREA